MVVLGVLMVSSNPSAVPPSPTRLVTPSARMSTGWSWPARCNDSWNRPGDTGVRKASASVQK